MENKKNYNVKKLLESILQVDKTFNKFSKVDLSETRYFDMVSLSNSLGGLEFSFKIDEANPLYRKYHPDCEKALTRIKIIRDRLYKEAQRRDEEEGR